MAVKADQRRTAPVAEIIDLMKARAWRRRTPLARDADGTFTGPRRHPEELLEIVREVAILASHYYPDEFNRHIPPEEKPPPEPSRVPGAVWNLARRHAADRFGPVPQANEVARQLRRATHKPYSWSIWLQIAFGEKGNPEKVVEQMLAAPDQPPTPAAVAFALRTVCRLLGLETLSFIEYERGRNELLAREDAAGRGREHAERRLPTSGQILTACGSWEAALHVAGLPPLRAASTRRSHDALPVPDAIVVFVAEHGYWPSRKQLDAYARKRSFALAQVRGKGWHAWIDEARARLADFPQLSDPGRYPSAALPKFWVPVEVEIELPPRGVREYPRWAVLEALREFLAWLPPGAKPTHRRYREFCTGRVGVPGLGAVLAHGPMKDLLSELDPKGMSSTG